MENNISLRVFGRNALMTDPITKTGGEKYSYLIPTYEVMKGVLKSIYWKPTFIWIIDRVRVIKKIITTSKGIKTLNYKGGNKIHNYTYLWDVEYQIEAHFEWNKYRPNLAKDRIDGKHFNIAKRMLEKGGRQDIFLGTRDCQVYVEPCEFGQGKGYYDEIDEKDFGIMFHGFDYPDEIGKNEFHSRFWNATMKKGIIEYPRPEECNLRRFIREMTPKEFSLKENILSVEQEEVFV